MGMLESPVCQGMPISIDINLTLGCPPCPPPPGPCGPEYNHDYNWQQSGPKNEMRLDSLIEKIIGCMKECKPEPSEHRSESPTPPPPSSTEPEGKSNNPFDRNENTSKDEEKENDDE